MVCMYFGLPGCGKTTALARIAFIESRKKGRARRYKNIYTNVRLSIPGVTYIDNECIGKYDLSECLLLIDEATLFADSRDFKKFDIGKLTYFLEHRHFKADIYLFTQQWDGVDRKIRVITDRVFYMFKTPITGLLFTCYYRIPYGIIIPDKKKAAAGEKLGEIIQGYCKPDLFHRIFCKRIFRPKYYKYFDTYERPELPPLPKKYQPYGVKLDSDTSDAAPANDILNQNNAYEELFNLK